MIRNMADKLKISLAELGIKLALLAAECLMTAFVLDLLGRRGFDGLTSGEMIALTLELLSLIFGVFLLAGSIGIKRREESFILLAFSVHGLLFLMAVARLIGKDPDLAALLDGIWKMHFILLAFSLQVLALYIRQTTDREGADFEMVTDMDSPEDRVEAAVLLAGSSMVLALGILNLFTGALLTVTEDGTAVKGQLYPLCCCLCLLTASILLFRIFAAKIQPERKRILFLTVLVPVLYGLCQILFQWTELLYPFLFLMLFLNCGEFFSNLNHRKIRMNDALESYVSEEMARKLLEEGEESTGKIYHASVLVSDLRGFTATCDKLEAEKLIPLLNHYFTEMMKIIQEHGGIVTEFLGDGLLCVFGAPEETEDHADRAVTAALCMQNRMEEINRWNREQGFPRIQMGIGLHTGELLFGAFGTSRTARLMAMGEVVNVAFRMEGSSLGGQVLLSEEMIPALKKPVKAKPLWDLDLGPGRCTKVWQILSQGEKEELKAPVRREDLVFLQKPVQVVFRSLSEKRVQKEQLSGEFISFTPDCFLLKTEESLKILENLRFEENLLIPQVLYAKVIKKEAEGQYRVAFTCIVEELEELYAAIQEYGSGPAGGTNEEA